MNQTSIAVVEVMNEFHNVSENMHCFHITTSAASSLISHLYSQGRNQRAVFPPTWGRN